MRNIDHSDVVVAGGGIAGSLMALVIGRKGFTVSLVDPRTDPAPTFRNEKLGHEQIALLRKLGALDCFAAACWPAPGERYAYPEHARPALYDCGAPHAEWIRSVRQAWPENVRLFEGVVSSIDASASAQTLSLTDGRRLGGRLVVLATGRLPTLAAGLGLRRRLLSANHSVCLGFSVAADLDVKAQVFAAPFGSGLAYVSIFPIPGEIRVNVFSYRDLRDDWTRRMSKDPIAAVAELLPDAAAALTGRGIVRRCEARGTDLYETRGHDDVPGVVLIGDAFHAPCPASGTGMLRILNDVDVLAETYVPKWLRTGDLSAARIALFYRDRRKRRVDRVSLRKSRLGRAHAVDTGPYWLARRIAKQALAQRR